MRLPDRSRTGAAAGWFPFFLFAVYLVAVPPTTDDVWWRLHAGKRILETGHVQDVNGWAYRDAAAAWVNHAAGHDVILAATHRGTGLPGLVFLYALPLLWLAWRFGRPQRRVDWFWAFTWPPLLAIHHALRPYVWSDALFFLAVLLAVRWHEREAPGWREAAPLWGLFYLWGWIHGAVWPALAFTLLFATRWGALAKGPAQEMARLRLLAPLPLLALANVHHVRGLALAWRYGSGDFAWLGRLTEWQPAPPAVLVVAGIFAAGFTLAWRARGLPRSRLLLLVPLAVAGILQIRHLPWLVVAALALLRAADREDTAAETSRARGRACEGGPVPARVAGLVLTALALTAGWLHAPRLADPRFHPAALYDAMEAGCRLDRPLRVFTLHAWGGSLIHRFDGRLAPFVDARNDCFSRETFGRYFRITRLEPGWYRLLWEDRPDAAALPPGHPLVSVLRARGWTLGPAAPDGVLLLAPHRAGLCPGR